MKRKLINAIILAIGIFCFVTMCHALYSCTYSDRTTEWINTHKKPIICINGGYRIADNAIRWTLIDADGNVYDTGPTRLMLPDTIFQKSELPIHICESCKWEGRPNLGKDDEPICPICGEQDIIGEKK